MLYGNILLFCKIERTRLVSFYGYHNLTANTSLIFSICLNISFGFIVFWAIKKHFKPAFFHFFHFPSEAPCLLAWPLNRSEVIPTYKMFSSQWHVTIIVIHVLLIRDTNNYWNINWQVTVWNRMIGRWVVAFSGVYVLLLLLEYI